MITLIELVNATTWLQPQDHMRVCVWDKSKVYEEKGEFTDIELNIRNLAKYSDYFVSDIDIESYNDEPVLSCLIRKE